MKRIEFTVVTSAVSAAIVASWVVMLGLHEHLESFGLDKMDIVYHVPHYTLERWRCGKASSIDPPFVQINSGHETLQVDAFFLLFGCDLMLLFLLDDPGHKFIHELHLLKLLRVEGTHILGDIKHDRRNCIPELFPELLLVLLNVH